MKKLFTPHEFNQENQALIATCEDIVNRYSNMGLKLTLRQLYYQLVTMNTIPNTERSYKRVGSVISDARLAGLIDWDTIEDRARIPHVPQEFINLEDLTDTAAQAYRLPRWDGQDCYVELWVEKDALSGVLSPLASEFHITLMVNRGYSSQSAMYESANRFTDHPNQECHLLYLGDHDPSGEDMVRDIEERLNEVFGALIGVHKIALTMEQVEQYDPPPNPAKMTDSRANGYVAKHGDECWEVDALPPDVLQELIRSSILNYLDVEKMSAIKEQEKLDIAKLKEAVKAL